MKKKCARVGRSQEVIIQILGKSIWLVNFVASLVRWVGSKLVDTKELPNG